MDKQEIIKMIRRVCSEERMTYQQTEDILLTIECESGFNPMAIGGINTNCTRDWGLCQFNDRYWIGENKVFPTPEYVLTHPEECVRLMCQEWKRGHEHYWVCYNKLKKQGIIKGRFGNINKTMDNLLLSRIKSFLWRGGAVLAVAGLNYIAQNIAGFGLPDYLVMIIGLVCGELTKYLNNAYKLGKMRRSGELDFTQKKVADIKKPK